MRTILLLGLVSATMLGTTGSPAHADATEFAAELGTRIHSEIVDDPRHEIGWGRATAVIESPTDRVWRAIQAYADYHEVFPYLRASRVLTQRGSNALVYLEAEVLHGTLTLWANLRMRASEDPDGSRMVEVRMTEGNMDVFVARWHIVPVDEERRSIVIFDLFVDPDLPLPDRLVTRGNQEGARLAVSALRREFT